MHSYSTYSLFIRDPHCNALSSSSPPSASFLFSGATVKSIQPFPPALSIKRLSKTASAFWGDYAAADAPIHKVKS